MSQDQLRVYDKEFKLNAVKLYHSSGRGYRQTSSELGIPMSTLVHWVHDHKKNGQESFPGKGYLKPSEAEYAQLRKELAIIREERDILKNRRKELLCPEGQKLPNAAGMMSGLKEVAVCFLVV